METTTIHLELTEQQIRDISIALNLYLNRNSTPSAKGRRLKHLARLQEEYYRQKQMDAVLLAANGGHFDLLSGNAGRLRHRISRFRDETLLINERIERVSALREMLKGMLPPISEEASSDTEMLSQEALHEF